MTNMPVYAGLLFFGLLYTPIELVLSILMQMISRKNEYEADRFAAATIEQPENLVGALKKLATTSLSNLTPHPFYVWLNYSHPPLLQRIRAIRTVASGNKP
jgi:STE24 endopeptidase